MSIRRFATLFLAAFGGAAFGSVVRQMVVARRSPTDERPELVVAIDLKAAGVGVVAGAATGRFGPVVAFFAAANAETTGLARWLGALRNEAAA